MRCPNCGSPIPLGSDFCFDCNTRIAGGDLDPWEIGEHTRIRRNTGEREYRRDQLRQERHERSHSNGTAHTKRPQPAAMPGSPEVQSVRSPGGQRTAKPKKKKGKGLAIFVLFVLVWSFFYFVVDNEGDIDLFSGASESQVYEDYEDYEEYEAEEYESEDYYEEEDGSYVEDGVRYSQEYTEGGGYIWYARDAEDDTLLAIGFCDEDGNEYRYEEYEDEELYMVIEYNDAGIAVLFEYYEDGELWDRYLYDDNGDDVCDEYYEDGQLVERDTYGEQGEIIYWEYFIDGEQVGANGSDPVEGGQVCWGTDRWGNSLTE